MCGNFKTNTGSGWVDVGGQYADKTKVYDGSAWVSVKTPTPQAVSYSDLVMWYRFEDGDARDYANNSYFADSTQYNGTVNGPTHESSNGVTDVNTGANSGCFNFGGGGDDITTSTIPTSTGTITFWVKDDGSNGYSIFFGQDVNYSSDYISYGQSGSEIELRGGGSRTRPNPGVNLLDGNWHHCAVRTDGSSVKVTADGTNHASSSASITFNSYENIGDPYQSTNYNCTGRADDIRVYNSWLTDTEIEQIYNNTKL